MRSADESLRFKKCAALVKKVAGRAAKFGRKKTVRDRNIKLIRWKEILMKKIAFVISVVFLLLSGVTLAQQTGEKKKDSSMQGMMKGDQSGGDSMHGMGGMDGMIGMMKMMEQCSAMMKSAQHEGEKAEESQDK
jgi:hypothetical protein